MKKFMILAAIICGFSMAQPAYAEKPLGQAIASEHYTFDKAHTQILFFVSHLGFSFSQGEFLDFDGSFNFDRTNPENSNVDITIKTSSIDMDHEKWDAHMKNPDLFNVEKYPAMTFKSTSIEVTGDNEANIIGDLTILDVTKSVILSVKHNKSDIQPYNQKYVSGFSAKTNIKRSDFGMTYGLPGVGDDVEIRIEVEGIRTEDDVQTPAE